MKSDAPEYAAKEKTRGLKSPQRGFSAFSVIVVFVALMILGMSVIPLLNIRLEPSRTMPSMEVTYAWPEASARVIEQEVTSVLEGLFSSIRGIAGIESVSYRGRGTITLTFKKTVNLDAMRFEVATFIRQAYPELPREVTWPEISVSTAGRNIQPILTYNLSAGASPYFIQKFATDNIVPHMAKVRGVSSVNIYGAMPYEWEITFSTRKLAALKLTSADIAAAVNNYFRREVAGTGSLVLPGRKYPNKVTLVLRTDIPRDALWSDIPVKKVGDRIIYLTDLATTAYKEKPPNAYYRINGLNTINIVIYPEEGVNNIRLAKKVKEEMSTLRKTFPANYSVRLSYDSTEYLSKEIHKIIVRTFLSLLILLLFVFLISRRFNYLLLITVSLVANLVIAFIFYYLLKVEIHLYSLAGITVSFGIIIDNTIVMIDHLRHHHNKKVFVAILAATLTTIGALSILFFLHEEQQINLLDFAKVIIVNLSVSLVIALFFIPALSEKIMLGTRRGRSFFGRRRLINRMTRRYAVMIRTGRRYRWAFILLLVLGFGIPVHWLPEEIKKDNFWASVYNKTLGSSFYQQKISTLAEKVLGGTLRLFTENVFERSFYSSPQRTVLYVNGRMPEGSTVQQLDQAIRKMENFISKYDEVEMFQTRITGYRNGSIAIYFKPGYENSAARAVNLGGLDWSIYGVGRGFSNALYAGYKNSHILLDGYNYDQLYGYAGILRSNLLKNPRIQEVDITGPGNYWNTSNIHEYFIRFHPEAFGMYHVTPDDFYRFLQDQTCRIPLQPVYHNEELQPVVMASDQAGKYNVWDLKNNPVRIGDRMVKLKSLASIDKRNTGNDIYKYNQQYRLDVAYDFIGPGTLGNRVMEEKIKEINGILPLGFKASQRTWGYWNKKDKKQYYLLILVIVIIYFICAILLESLTQPLAIISMVPVSFIGVFLTFYLFDFNFDQGGFASFVFLSGIVVNSGLYIVNDYNNFCREHHAAGSLRLYLKAYNHKIIPVILTIFSTVLGLVPFVVSGQNEVFWFAFAVGTMGGLLFSFIAIWVYLPLFMSIQNSSSHDYSNY